MSFPFNQLLHTSNNFTISELWQKYVVWRRVWEQKCVQTTHFTHLKWVGFWVVPTIFC